MKAWQRYLIKEKEKKKYQSYRSFGDLTDDSIVTDLYNSKYKKKKRRNNYGREKSYRSNK